MRNITVYRKWYDIFGLFRKLNLYINDKKVGYLSVWNSAHTIQIENQQLAELSLVAKMDWCESEPNKLEHKADDPLELVVSTNTLVLLSLYGTMAVLIFNSFSLQLRHTILPFELLTVIPFFYYLILKPGKFFAIHRK